MNQKQIESAISEATRAAEQAGEFKSETFSAVLLACLLRTGERESETDLTPTVPQKNPMSLARRLSPSEFFAEKAWETEVDKVVLAGCFLERYSSVPRYTVH